MDHNRTEPAPGPSGASRQLGINQASLPTCQQRATSGTLPAPKVRQTLTKPAGAVPRRTLFDPPRVYPDVEALILDTDCPANPGAPCVGKHGAGGREGLCPLLYRALEGRVIGRGGTRNIRPEHHVLMCAHPDAAAGGVLGIVRHHLPGSIRENVPLKPRITPEIRQAIQLATGRAI